MMPSIIRLVLQNETSYTFTNFQDVYYGTGGNHDNFFFTYISSWYVRVCVKIWGGVFSVSLMNGF